MLTLNSYRISKPSRELLRDNKTNWDQYGETVHLGIQMPAGTIKKSETDNAMNYFTNIARTAVQSATPKMIHSEATCKRQMLSPTIMKVT